jgi:hypothetical protein
MLLEEMRELFYDRCVLLPGMYDIGTTERGRQTIPEMQAHQVRDILIVLS